MTIETSIYATLKTLVENRVYRDLAPDNVTALPRITFVQVGGVSINFVDSATIPSKGNARVQINCWDDRRDDVMALALQVEAALRAATTLHTTVLGAAVAVYEDDTKLFGSIQDFSFWT